MAEERETHVALIIGNARYHYACPLKNPANDAKAIGQAFGRLGFATTKPQLNLGYNAFRRALQRFAERADRAEMAVIYFAGHGIEVNSNNFLIPIDARLGRPKDADYEAISLDRVLRSVDGARQLRLVILDACRDNPFRARMLRPRGTHSIGKGLREIEDPGSVFVAYAAKHGTYALDGDGVNSPFVEALLRHIETPGLEIGKLFGEVRDDVLELTGGRQEPYTYGSRGRKDICLKPRPDDAKPSPPDEDDDPLPVPPPPAHRPIAIAVGAGLVTAVATFITLSVLPLSPKTRLPDDAEAKRIQRLVDDANQPAAEKAAAAREQLSGLGLVRVKVKSARGARETWIRPGAGKDDAHSFRDCWGKDGEENRCGPRMVAIPAGTFQMGSPQNEPGRKNDEDDMAGAGGQRVPITFKTPFAVGAFEITFAQWDSCLHDGGCQTGSLRVNGEKNDQPVVNLSWRDITEQYLPWLNRKVSGRVDGPYRLPSEAEWEYAARAETSSPYWFGDTIGEGRANVESRNTMPVHSLAANNWGLYHVHGNVWEWVQDRYLDSYKDMPSDGTCPQPAAQTHVVRGGSFTNKAGDLRSAKRLAVFSHDRNPDIGFRVARALEF
jgi:formylglycine-generating enzyme required for sulfatase activity